MRLLVINYHYLKYKNKKLMPANGISDYVFEKQLKELKRYYIPISFDYYRRIAGSKKKDSNRYVIVTFDDGIIDCVKRVMPIALSMHFPISFFIPGLPVEKHRLLFVQKIHLLLAKTNTRSLAKIFYDELGYFNKVKRINLKKMAIRSAYPYDKGITRRFKLDVNYLIPYTIRDLIINNIFQRYYQNEEALARSLYLDIDDIKTLACSNFEIGGHSYSHPLFSRLTRREQEYEIKKCRNILNRVTTKALPFSIPFGHLGTFTQTTKKLLKKHKFFNLITMQRKINVNNLDQYSISRFDVNDVFDGFKLKTRFR